jgi:transposase
MRPYSEDLRLKAALDAVDSGMPREEVARVFGISVPSIKRWLRRRRETGDVAPSAPIPGPAAIKGDLLREWLPARLQSEPDPTLEEHCEAFEEARGVKVSKATMCRSISRLPDGGGGGWPLKKSLP